MKLASTLIETCSTADRALAGVAVLFSVGLVVTSLELLRERRRLWHVHGLLVWPVMATASAGEFPGALRRCLHATCRPFVLDLLLILRILAAVMLIASAATGGSPFVPLAVIALVHLALNWRLHHTLDASDRMSGLVAFTLLIAAAFQDDGIIRVAALSFLTVQLALAYVVAGVSKALTASWWNGRALQGTLGTVVFGVPMLHRMVVRFPTMARVASWSVILFEVAFPLAFLGPPAVTVTFLAVGALFHAGVAAVMGLNSFLYFFVATYPAVCYTSSALRTGVFGWS